MPDSPDYRKRALRVLPLLAAVVLSVAVGIGIKYGRHHVWPTRFAVVEDGLYRSGLLKPGPLRRVVSDHHLKTIVTLLGEEPDDPDQKNEQLTAEREGVELVRIPMPGDGCADFDSLEKAAAVIADESKRPLLVHCSAGVQRTGAAYAVWRMKYQGWDVQRAVREVIDHGHDPDDGRNLTQHLQRYYQERIAASRPAVN